MEALLARFLEATVFDSDSNHKMAFLPQRENSEQKGEEPARNRGALVVPDQFFPPDCKVVWLPDGEAFLLAVLESLPTDHPLDLYLFPAFMGRNRLSDRLRAEFPGMMDLAEIILGRVVEKIAHGSRVWASMPSYFGSDESSKTLRDSLTQIARVRLIMTNDFLSDLFGLRHQIITSGILLEKLISSGHTVRLFNSPQIGSEGQNSEAEIISDFHRLLLKKSGVSTYGFVLPGGIPPGNPWRFKSLHPDLTKRLEDLAHLGSLQNLEAFVEVVEGLHPKSDAQLLLDGVGNDGVIVLEGRSINADETINFDEPRRRAQVSEERLVRPGDICIPTIQSHKSRLKFGVIAYGMPPAVTTSQSVILLRPRAEIDLQTFDVLVSYFRSTAFFDLLKSRCSTLADSVRISVRGLLSISVPVADEPLRAAVATLGRAAAQFRTWADELEAVRGSMFDSQSAKETRNRTLLMGRLAKQRYEAAILVSDFKQRLRTRFPHPIAFRWRTVESQHPNLEGYIHVLECAEIAVAYLAFMALVLGKLVDKPVPWIKQISERISTKGHGTNMGDWIAILQDVSGSRFAADIDESTSFIEVTRFQRDQRVGESLKWLAASRNDQSHGRGPKGSATEKAFLEAKHHLETFLQGIEFISDYPLRFVEKTRRDTLRRMTIYSFRELMGDHALVPLGQAEILDSEIEADSLYLYDRIGKLHLLRPLMIGRECPVCNSWGTFFLDGFAKSKSQGERCVMKSMEHGHTCADMDLVAAFRHWGMIQ